mgnify:CR=1 FL=1
MSLLLRSVSITVLLFLTSFLAISQLNAQVIEKESTQPKQPTVNNPVLVSFEAVDDKIQAGQSSSLTITFKVPKYVWLGASPEVARTPPGTKIDFKESPYFTFGEPNYPEPSVEGVPVKVGVTRVYMGEITVVVPFKVADDAKPGTYDITTLLTYTPGFNAGKLTTKAKEPHTTSLTVVDEESPRASTPQPSITEVPESFSVQRVVWDFPPILNPMLKEYREGTAVSNMLHTIFIDPPNHGKTLRQAFFPFIENTLQNGNSFGLGMVILNATPEGVMTGALSASVFNNEFVDATGAVELITCPAAYHNLQVSAEYSGEDYRAFIVDYENFTLGANDRFGIQADIDIFTDPRYLFYGIGAAANQEDVAAYDHQNAGGTVDFYYFPIQKLRIGGGFKFRDVNIDRGLTDIDGDAFDLDGDVPLMTDANFDNPELNTGSTVVGGRANLIYDGRNQEFNPTKGFFGKITAEFNSVTEDKGSDIVDDYSKFHVDLRQYVSPPSQKWVFVMRNEWAFTTEKNIPFYELPSLGGLRSIRAFDINRFRDQHSFYASMEMRYTLAHINVMGFPMAMVMSGFLDAGQVFNEDQKLNFSNDFNWAPGVSIRLVNYPNIGYTLNIATAEDGVYISGGISLPI